MAAAPDLHLTETPPGTVRMNINQDHLPGHVAKMLGGEIRVETNIQTQEDLITVTLLPGAVIELFAEGMAIASFQVKHDGSGIEDFSA